MSEASKKIEDIFDELEFLTCRELVEFAKSQPDWDWERFGARMSKSWSRAILEGVSQSARDTFVRGILKSIAD